MSSRIGFVIIVYIMVNNTKMVVTELNKFFVEHNKILSIFRRFSNRKETENFDFCDYSWLALEKTPFISFFWCYLLKQIVQSS